MSEATILRKMHQSLAQGPAWHGPAVLPLVNGLPHEQAAAHPVEGAHSIWELLLHINAWQEYAIEVLSGRDQLSLEGEADWPRVGEASAKNWVASIERFKASNARLLELIESAGDEGLRRIVPGREFPVKVMLYGVVNHNAYHAGQIGLLRKAAGVHGLAVDAAAGTG